MSFGDTGALVYLWFAPAIMTFSLFMEISNYTFHFSRYTNNEFLVTVTIVAVFRFTGILVISLIGAWFFYSYLEWFWILWVFFAIISFAAFVFIGSIMLLFSLVPLCYKKYKLLKNQRFPD